MLAHHGRSRLDRHILIAVDQVFVVNAFNRQIEKLGALFGGFEIVGNDFSIGSIQHAFAEDVGKKVGKRFNSLAGIQKQVFGQNIKIRILGNP